MFNEADIYAWIAAVDADVTNVRGLDMEARLIEGLTWKQGQCESKHGGSAAGAAGP